MEIEDYDELSEGGSSSSEEVIKKEIGPLISPQRMEPEDSPLPLNVNQNESDEVEPDPDNPTPRRETDQFKAMNMLGEYASKGGVEGGTTETVEA